MSDGMDMRQWKDMMGETAQPLDALPNDELVAKVREAKEALLLVTGREARGIWNLRHDTALSVLAGRLQDAQVPNVPDDFIYAIVNEVTSRWVDGRYGARGKIVDEEGLLTSIRSHFLARFAAVPPNQAEEPLGLMEGGGDRAGE